jgi:trehalose-phosphatase
VRPVIDCRNVDAVVFDMDGVITDTASVHEAAWKRLFDAYLQRTLGAGAREFSGADYRDYVDGKMRYDGVASFLQSRGIELPWGTEQDGPDAETICGLGNRKNLLFREHIAEHGVAAYPSTIALIAQLRAAGVGVGMISGSRNATEVLHRVGLDDHFDAKVDGTETQRLGIPGKPAPDVFVEAARRMGTTPDRAVVVEDATAGVEAGRRGGFALVIGVDRTGHARELLDAGADVVVADLEEVTVTHESTTAIADLPTVAADARELLLRLDGREPAVFLDYDGTLTPIVERAEDATIDDRVRATIAGLSQLCTVAVVSGRDLADVRHMVGVEGIWFAGSHGFDIVAPDGTSTQHGAEFLPALDAAEAALRPRLAAIDGARLERKRFAIAAHFRQVSSDDVDQVEREVRAVAAEQPDLKVTGGKMIFELRPNLDWHKGRALLALIDTLGLDRDDVVPLYIGDDETDEDGFRALEGRGIGLVVRGEGDQRPTAAHFALDDPAAVVTLLESLRAHLSEGPRR